MDRIEFIMLIIMCVCAGIVTGVFAPSKSVRFIGWSYAMIIGLNALMIGMVWLNLKLNLMVSRMKLIDQGLIKGDQEC